MTGPRGMAARRDLFGSFSVLSQFRVMAIGMVTAAGLSRCREDNMRRCDAEGMQQLTDRVARHQETTNLSATGEEPHCQPAPQEFLWHTPRLPEVLRPLAPSVHLRDRPGTGPAPGRPFPRRCGTCVSRHGGEGFGTTAEFVLPTAA